MAKYNFQDFLNDKFYAENRNALDDDYPEAFDEWLSELDVDTWMEYAEQYATRRNNG